MEREGRKLKEFLEDYDDERDDPKFYKGRELQRRLADRFVIYFPSKRLRLVVSVLCKSGTVFIALTTGRGKLPRTVRIAEESWTR